jgi:putative ABC transport system permease protein
MAGNKRYMFVTLLKEGMLFAVNSVTVNKLRTFLSLFGITIGIFSIISVFTALDWMAKSVHDSISTLGDNVIYIQKWPWSFDRNLAWWDIVKWPAVSLDDYHSVLNRSTKSESACFIASQQVQIKYKKNIASESAAASTYEFKDIRAFEIEKGRYFSPFDCSSGKNVAILGNVLAEKLFDKADPIGKEITIAGFKTTVIGVTKKEGQGNLVGSELDELALVPINFGKTFINLRNRFIGTQIMVKAKPGVAVQELTDEIKMILRAERRIRPGEKENFSMNQATLLTQGFDAVFAGINIGGWIIGGFAILVGGFGIANIMFVSVRERTNQIGIQKALGAKRFFILQQFLVESFLLSVLGGILGVIMVFIGTLIVNYNSDLHMYLTLGNISLAIVISGIIGIVAGYAPALAAAKMNPVDAIGFSF